MTPSYSVFNQLFILSEEICDTYDYLPNADANYPFCYIEQPLHQNAENSDLFGECSVLIHWYGKRSDRYLIDEIAGKFHDLTSNIDSEFDYAMSRLSWNDRWLPNPQDEPNVIHHIADLKIIYNRKEQ